MFEDEPEKVPDTHTLLLQLQEILDTARKLPMSSHLFPEVSAHLLAVTPTCHFLEYMDWANVVLAEPITIKDSHAYIPERPGNGMTWDESAVARYQFE